MGEAYVSPWQGQLRPDGLTARQAKFAELFVQRKYSRTACAKMAGYPQPYYVAANELLDERRSPLVVKYIRIMQAELEELHSVDEAGHLMRLAEIRDKALEAGVMAVALGAEKARGQVKGMYVERSEKVITVIDSMSSEQLADEIRKLAETHPQLAKLTAPTLELMVNEESAGTIAVEEVAVSDTSNALDKD